mmetsp:Transcript_65610/g.186119  ORF Transcript_65610/g.186119 Transcript_65610/m.186119 type:complete len:332 (-) Transcript_65610:100-1095(-)|eukprot:CAMPEP_0168434878 /NCGR_PEP_ID=MMETSP0228-20121227/40130_1 /TAXON_ID=133427 /ORGANISM="Protoceratium reticulatum, Strain CCCM 535 (=CCMP 1889)" /LENGTH=331 /DNA_ID=CAMNT_0008449043 /DNA_START=50 /DNA_END=1045 /DNA_ORIENTATION=-
MASRGADIPLPSVPDDVEFCTEFFTNPQGLKLQAYRFGQRRGGHKGVVWLNHGYASHTIFEWFLPAKEGEPHDMWSGSILDILVSAGYLVCTLDQQSMGRSEGLHGLVCYMDKFDDLPEENLAYLNTVLLKDPEVQRLPLFILGISMGGATSVRMAQMQPHLFRGVVLLAPMLSLEEVKKKQVFCCIRNGHLMPVAGVLSRLLPTVAIAKGQKNTLHPLSQKEADDDPLCYHGDVRNRCARCFQNVTDYFMSGGGLREMRTPFVTIHSARDTFTDPAGSQRLLNMAEVEDKTYLKVGPGLDLDLNMWHCLTGEPGYDVVFEKILEWFGKRT